MITILGSCRQYSIRDNESCNNILDELAYPHYSKEALQAIRYLKYNNIPKEKTRLCFRTGIIENKELEWEPLYKQYEKSKIVIVEIASLKEYKYEDLYLSHATYDDMKYKVSQELKGLIKTRTQEKNELFDDIRNIRDELSDKKLIIVCHICTRKYGTRFILTQWLEEICKELSIEFINPNILLQKYSAESLFVNEAVMLHYTDFGHKKIYDEVYKKVLDKIKNEIIC